MNTIFELITYLKNPVLKKDQNRDFLHQIKVFLILLITSLCISFFLSIIIGIIYSAGLIENDYHAFDDLKKLKNYEVLLTAAVFAPIIEEFFFRAPLVLFKKPQYFKIAFYAFAIIFGLVHLFNYQIDSQILLFAPILIAPQLILGLIFGFIRIRLGFLWAILMHAAYNGILVSLFLFAKDAIQIE